MTLLFQLCRVDAKFFLFLSFLSFLLHFWYLGKCLDAFHIRMFKTITSCDLKMRSMEAATLTTSRRCWCLCDAQQGGICTWNLRFGDICGILKLGKSNPGNCCVTYLMIFDVILPHTRFISTILDSILSYFVSMSPNNSSETAAKARHQFEFRCR